MMEPRIAAGIKSAKIVPDPDRVKTVAGAVEWTRQTGRPFLFLFFDGIRPHQAERNRQAQVMTMVIINRDVEGGRG